MTTPGPPESHIRTLVAATDPIKNDHRKITGVWRKKNLDTLTDLVKRLEVLLLFAPLEVSSRYHEDSEYAETLKTTCRLLEEISQFYRMTAEWNRLKTTAKSSYISESAQKYSSQLRECFALLSAERSSPTTSAITVASTYPSMDILPPIPPSVSPARARQICLFVANVITPLPFAGPILGGGIRFCFGDRESRERDHQTLIDIHCVLEAIVQCLFQSGMVREVTADGKVTLEGEVSLEIREKANELSRFFSEFSKVSELLQQKQNSNWWRSNRDSASSSEALLALSGYITQYQQALMNAFATEATSKEWEPLLLKAITQYQQEIMNGLAMEATSKEWQPLLLSAIRVAPVSTGIFFLMVGK